MTQSNPGSAAYGFAWSSDPKRAGEIILAFRANQNAQIQQWVSLGCFPLLSQFNLDLTPFLSTCSACQASARRLLSLRSSSPYRSNSRKRFQSLVFEEHDGSGTSSAWSSWWYDSWRSNAVWRRIAISSEPEWSNSSTWTFRWRENTGSWSRTC